MKRCRLIPKTLIVVIIIQCISAFCINVNAADRNSVKQSGEYYSGSVYGPYLSSTELDAVADAVASFLNEYIIDGMTELQKVRAACDYLDATCAYASSWAENNANTAWGSLVYHEAQCSGYARGFKALCDGMEINCYYVRESGADNGAHQWNEVQIDGVWYIIDTTMMDQNSDSARAMMSAYAYLVSGDVYYNAFKYGWDTNGLPECVTNYPTSAKYYEILGGSLKGQSITINPSDYQYMESAFASEAVKYVYSGSQNILINEALQAVETYNINDSNYVKLRDIAYILNGTENNFNITWDDNNNILWIDTKTPYIAVGGELETGAGEKGVLNPTSAASFRVDGIEYAPDSYNIRNNNYYKLRDIGNFIGFGVDWDESSQTVIITSAPTESITQLPAPGTPSNSVAMFEDDPDIPDFGAFYNIDCDLHIPGSMSTSNISSYEYYIEKDSIDITQYASHLEACGIQRVASDRDITEGWLYLGNKKLIILGYLDSNCYYVLIKYFIF